jgi:hypothetical protein
MSEIEEAQRQVLGTGVAWAPPRAGAEPEPFDVLDENVTPLPTNVGRKNLIARLRKGMHIQVGSDANDPASFIFGPADVPLTPKMAIANMAKWENPNDVKVWLAREYPKLVEGKPNLLPRTKRRQTPQERFDTVVNGAREQNLARRTLPGDGVSRAEVGQMINAAVAPLAEGINRLLANAGQPARIGPERAQSVGRRVGRYKKR